MNYEMKSNAQLIAEVEQLQKKVATLEAQNATQKHLEEIVHRSKEEWKQTFDIVPDLIAILDKDHRIVRVNEAMAKRLGVIPEECIGLFCFEAVHDTDFPPDYCPFSKTIVDGKEHRVEMYEERLGGDFDLTTSPYFDEGGNVAGAVHVARDITASKWVEEALGESEERFRAIVEGTKACLFSTNLRGRFNFINEAAIEVLGYSQSELHGKFYLNFVHPIDKRRVHKVFQNQLKTSKKSATIEFRFVTKGGSIGWFMFLVNPIIKNGMTIGLAGVAQDITKRKQAEIALNDSMERLKGFDQHSTEGVYRIDIVEPVPIGLPKSKIIDWINEHAIVGEANNSLANMYGLEPKDMIGKPAIEFAPSYGERAALILEKNDYRVINEETKDVDKDGKTLYLIENYHGIVKEGHLVSIWGAQSNITERKQAERKLQQTHNDLEATLIAIPDLFFEVDPEGRIYRYNAPKKDQLDLPLEDFLGRTIAEVLPKDVSEIIMNGISKALERGYYYGAEYSLDMPDGKHWFEISIANRKRDSGGYERLIALARDITDRKRIEKVLGESEAQFRTLSDMTTEGIMIHRKGIIILVNQAFADLVSVSDPDTLTGEFGPDIIPFTPDSKDSILQQMQSNSENTLDIELLRPDGSITIAETSGCFVSYKGEEVRLVYMRDTTERKLSEEYREMGREILQVLNQPEDFQDSIQQLLNILKTRTKFDAVGIRMQDGDDFPYIAQEGFSKAFLKTENSLIERSADGGLCRDKDGNVQLECTCGLIISGKTDPSNPLFTKGGSAWTNDSLPLLDIPPEEDPRNHPRNMCIHQGYASIALVPIRNMDRIIGTIQLNDRRKGCLTLERVELLEGIASHIGAALMRKQAEEALRESVKKYQLLADNLTDVIWTRDLNLKITYISPSIYAQSGFTPAEKMQLPIQDTMTQESLSLIGQIFGEELNIEKTETGNPNRSRTVDIEMCHKNGSIYPVEVSVSFLRNKDGKAYGLLGVTRDITKRKQVEKKIRESEKNFRDLTENLMDGIAIIDENGNHIFTNPKYSEITGYSNEELQKITGWDLTRPEDVNLLKQRMEKRIEGKSHIKNYERIIVRKDGTELQAEMSTTTTLWQGKMRPMAIIRDITERKLAEDTLRESEERYRILATNTQDTIWMADLEFNLTYINGAIFNFLGYTAEEITCLKLADFTPPAGRQMIQNAVEQLLANYNQGKSSQVTIELQHYRKDRTIIDAEITANLLIDTDGKFIGFQGRSVDISERKRGHLTLQKSEKRFRDMADLLPQVVFEMDLSGKLTYVNRSAFDIFGYTPEELDEGVNVFDIIPPEEHSRVKENIHKALIGETRRNHEYTALRRDGSRFPISIYSSPVISNGNAIGLRGIVVDITEHKLAEEEHRKSEQRFRNIVDNSPMGVHMYELQSEDRLVFIGANPAANSLLGVDNSIFIGKTIEEAFPPLAQTEVVLRYKEAAKSGIPWSTEQISYEDDQITGAFEVAAFQTAPGKMVALFNNITNRKQAQEALKESEERYRRLFEDDLAGNYISTPIGEIITCNLAFARIFGFDSVDEILLTQIESLYINQQDRKDFLQLLGERRKLEFYEKEFRHKTGHTLHIIENAVGAFDESHNLIQIRGHIIDNTEHKQLEDQLRQSQKMEGIGRLAGGIAHDFNNLMTSIMCNAELSLMDLDTNDPLNKNMKEIQTTAERAGALTSQLLAFSRKQSLQPRVLNLNSQISEIRNMLIRTIGEDIDLRVILGDDIWMVKADPGQIDQVIVNLVVNARDAMPNGGELTLETQNVVLEEEYTKKHHLITPGNFVMLAVSDSGIGMSEEVIAKIFEPFFTTKLKTTGTGLGLSTVYGIIKQSNGMINVFSEPDNGSSFRIYLPTIAEKAEKIVKSDFSGSVPRGTETVLIIEDEEGVRKAAAMVLKRLGYKITEADSGAAALILCKRMQKQVDLVITDVVMPYMSGVEFVEQLCEIWHDVKVLFMSGYTENSIIHKKILKPGIPYMQKPFRTLDIALKVREVLDS